MQVLRVSDNFPSFLEHDGLIVTMNDQLDKVEPTPGLENVDPPFFPWFNSIDNVTYYTNVDGYPPPQGQPVELNDAGFVCLKYNPDAVEDFYTVYTIDVTKNDNTDLAGINTSGFVSLGVSAPLSNPTIEYTIYANSIDRKARAYKGSFNFSDSNTTIVLEPNSVYMCIMTMSGLEVWDNPNYNGEYDNSICQFIQLTMRDTSEVYVPFPTTINYTTFTSWTVVSLFKRSANPTSNTIIIDFTLFMTDSDPDKFTDDNIYDNYVGCMNTKGNSSSVIICQLPMIHET